MSPTLHHLFPKHLLTAFLIAGGLLGLLNASAADWFEVYENEYIDRDSVRVQGSVVRFWLNVRYPLKPFQELLQEEMPHRWRTYQSSIQSYQINCKTLQRRISKTKLLNANNKTLYVFDDVRWVRIKRDTVADFYRQTVCNMDR